MSVLENKVALVTGASRGVGHGIALGLAHALLVPLGADSNSRANLPQTTASRKRGPLRAPRN